jgi:hypothetical protein
VPAGDTANAAVLGRPTALSTSTQQADPAVRPVSFSTADDGLQRPIIRLQAPEVPKPMPTSGGQEKSSDKGTDVRQPREVRETLTPSFPPMPQSVVPPAATIPSDPGDFCVSADCGAPGFCGNGCCGPCGCGCGDGNLWWVDAEYLLWWIRSGNTPPLVTTGPASTFGVLGQPGTQVLFGGLDYGASSGGRFSTGLWFCESQVLGIDASFLFLGTTSVNFLAASNSMGSPVLSRPFIGAVTGQQTVEQVAFPGEQAGSVGVHSSSRLIGAETNLRWNPYCLCGNGMCGGSWRIGFLGGFRFLSLREDLDIAEDFNDLGDIVTRHQITDSFSTRNRFYGGQLGTVIELKRGAWSLDMRAKVALGATSQVAHVSGSEVDTSLNTGQQVRFNTGLLALPTNIGRFSRDQFSVVPELGINLGYQLCEHWRLFVGYNFIYWNNVARPGTLIDPVVNTTQQSGGTLTGPARPTFAFRNTDFWAHGVNFGLELRY